MNMVFDAYAAYYDLLYQDKNYQKEAQYICGLLDDNGIRSGEILELGSGTGKHAEEFAKMGFCVHGIDLSQKMIQEANHRNNNQKDKLFFEVGDVRDFKAGKKFDAVIDEIISVETVKIFKPSPLVYKQVEKIMECSKSDVLFVSSNGWGFFASDYLEGLAERLFASHQAMHSFGLRSSSVDGHSLNMEY